MRNYFSVRTKDSSDYHYNIIMTELIKSYRMYRLSISGMPLYSPSTHLWALRNVAAYRKNRMQILRQCELGYFQQLRNMLKRNKQILDVEQNMARVRDPEEIDIKRVDLKAEIQSEKDSQKQQKAQNLWFRVKMTTQSIQNQTIHISWIFSLFKFSHNYDDISFFTMA